MRVRGHDSSFLPARSIYTGNIRHTLDSVGLSALDYRELMTTRADFHNETAQGFLIKARTYLAEDDLLQASQRAWGAAAQTVKAIAEQRGWRHRSHGDLFQIVDRLADESNDDELLDLFHVANSLHQNFYEGWQTARLVEAGLAGVEEFVGRVERLSS